MASLTEGEFHDLLRAFERESVHVEMRDSYGTEVELPKMARWAAGDADDGEWLREYCERVRADAVIGKRRRRAHVISEPLSDYHKWVMSMIQPMVDAGDDVRWVPRRLVSSLAFPGNDFYLLDDRLVIFLHYAGDGRNVAFTTSTDSHDIDLCRSAFEAVWPLGVPHGEYKTP
jgi:hypothetical protein